jgi:hypothetical protein
MASNSKSGLTKEERRDFLCEHGFVPLHSGKGSHEIWTHPELKKLSRKHPIIPPANILSNTAQKPWETTLCGNPGEGTWNSMVKHAKWCQETVEQIKTKDLREQQRTETARQFRASVQQICQWRKDVKHWLKSGLKVSEAPKTPIQWHDFKAQKAKKSELSLN